MTQVLLISCMEFLVLLETSRVEGSVLLLKIKVLYQVEISQIDQLLVFSEGHCTEGVRAKVTVGHIENSQNHL